MPPRTRQPAASDPPPLLPGGCTVGDKVFYTDSSDTFDYGNKVVHGQQGEVTGPATLESLKGKGLEMLFPGNKDSINCGLTEVRRLPPLPPLPPCARASNKRHCPRPARGRPPATCLCPGAPTPIARGLLSKAHPPCFGFVVNVRR